MKILLVTEFFSGKKCNFSGGVETRTFFIAKNLSKRHKITVICRRRKGERQKESYSNLKIFRLGKQALDYEVKFLSIFPRLNFVAHSILFGLKQKEDLVEGSNFICFLPAFVIAWFKKIPSIAWYPDLLGKAWLKNFGITGIFGYLLEKIGIVLPWKGVIALSKQTKHKLIKAGIRKEKIKVIYGGVDLEFIKKIKIKKRTQPTICCIARLVPYKNIDRLIKAVQLIKLDLRNIKCIIIGEGPEKKELIKLIRELEIKQNIEFKENLSYQEIIRTLKSSHLFCLPSEIEGFGLTTIEALACGIPFIISDIAINHEVTKGLGGLFFRVNDAQDLAKKATRLLKNRNLSNHLSRQGQKLLNFYNWDRIASQTEDFYEQNC